MEIYKKKNLRQNLLTQEWKYEGDMNNYTPPTILLQQENANAK